MVSNRVILLSLSFVFFTLYGKASGLETYFARADAFLSKYVSDGSVAYSKVKQNISEIESLYKEIGDMDLSGARDDEKKAFYINSYNLVVIYWVAKHYPLKSPMDDSGFFDKVRHTVAGESLTLNALEIKKLLLVYKDPRIHFALACAAKSCPPLASFAFEPDKLNKQLNERTTEALNDPSWLMVQRSKKTVQVSKIFDWYSKDFLQNGKTVVEWINQYRDERIPASYSVQYYEYNWALNDR
jgi:Protein of unknown function, DUF547